MTTGKDLVELAAEHIGERYDHAPRPPKDDPNWNGPWDCAEIISWAVFQKTGKLYGCTDNAAAPRVADAYTGAWKRDALKGVVQRIPVDEAVATPGAILLRYPPRDGAMGHIVFCDGEGGTVEAMGRNYGVTRGKVAGRRWDTGVLIPGVTYGRASEPETVAAPAAVYAVNLPNMNRTIVAEIQKALKLKGFEPGAIDGEFGERTAEAVAAFQDRAGLVADGEVGERTAKALGINLLGAAAAAAGAVIKGVIGSNPLLAVAAAIFPDIAKAIAGDRTGAVAGQAARAVSDVTGASEAGVAKATLAADPEATAALQAKLAEISLAQEESRRKAAAEATAAQEAAAAQDRRAEFEKLNATLKDVADARRQATKWARIGGPMAWGAPIVSVVVVAGFLIFLGVLVFASKWLDLQPNEPLYQLLNVTIGALTAAFTTVVNFWLGSSLGSRRKDDANADLQTQQVEQTKEIVKSQNEFAKEIVEKAPAIAQAASGPAPVAPTPAATASNFKRCVDIVIGREGGFVENPKDPGGATNLGITLATLRSWRSDDDRSDNDTVTVDDVRKLTIEDAQDIYRTRYWNALRCDELPAGIDLMVFDFGVNAGPSRAAKILQKVVGAEADGSIGPRTIAAAKAGSAREAISAMAKERLAFYQKLPTWETFGNGWTNRTKAVEAAALAMATS